MSALASRCQAEGDDCIPAQANALFDFFQELSFQVVGIGNYLTRGNFLVSRAVITEFANSQTFIRPNRWPEDAASHRARFVQFAQPSLRIEHGTWLIISKIFKALASLLALAQDSGRGISGETFRQAGDRIPSAFADRRGTLGIAGLQLCQPPSQSQGIELIDGESANAALRAPRTAHEPFSAPACGVGQRGVNDLNQLLIPRRWKTKRHEISIPQQLLFIIVVLWLGFYLSGIYLS